MVCGYQCVNQACIECQDGEKRCTQLPTSTTDVEICSGGQWTSWTSSDATCIGEQQCVNGACTSDVTPGMKKCNNMKYNVVNIYCTSQYNIILV